MDNIRNDLTHLKNQQKWQKKKKHETVKNDGKNPIQET